ncbi:unnamed protein product [Lota lota]
MGSLRRWAVLYDSNPVPNDSIPVLYDSNPVPNDSIPVPNDSTQVPNDSTPVIDYLQTLYTENCWPTCQGPPLLLQLITDVFSTWCTLAWCKMTSWSTLGLP